MARLEERGIRHHLSDGPAMPPAAQQAWAWFLELNQGRQGGMGLQALTWADLHGFFALCGIEPSPIELRLIRAFDSAFLTVYAPKETAK